MTNRQRLVILFGLAISVIFLWVAFRDLNPQAVLEHLGGVNLPLILAAAAWYFSAVTVISARWGFLLRSVQQVPLRNLVELVSIGYMGNNIYPLRAGEVLRVALLQRRHGVPVACGVTTAITERIFDGIVMLTFILVSLAVFQVPAGETVRQVATLTMPIFVLALVAFLALAQRPEVLRKLIEWFSRWLPRPLRPIAARLTDGVIEGLGGLRTPLDLAGTVVFSYLSWMLEASVYYLVALAFNLGIDYPTALLIVGVVNLAGLIPASPGQFGVYEFFVITVLVGVGIAEAPAQAYALVVHLVIWLPVTLAGFATLARLGLGLSAVTHARELDRKAVTS